MLKENEHMIPTKYFSREKWTYKIGRACNIFSAAAIFSASLYILKADSVFPCNKNIK